MGARAHIAGTIETVQDSSYEQLQTRVAGLAYEMELQDGGRFSVDYDSISERLNEPFDIHPGVVVSAGEYDFGEVRVRYQSNRSAALSGEIELGNGSFWSGDRKQVSGGLRVRFNRHFAVSGSFERHSIDLPEGSFVTRLGTLRFDWSLTPRMFLNAFVQHNSDTDTWLSNVRFNLIHRPLSDIFVVWNETRGPGLALRDREIHPHVFFLTTVPKRSTHNESKQQLTESLATGRIT